MIDRRISLVALPSRDRVCEFFHSRGNPYINVFITKLILSDGIQVPTTFFIINRIITLQQAACKFANENTSSNPSSREHMVSSYNLFGVDEFAFAPLPALTGPIGFPSRVSRSNVSTETSNRFTASFNNRFSSQSVRFSCWLSVHIRLQSVRISLIISSLSPFFVLEIRRSDPHAPSSRYVSSYLILLTLPVPFSSSSRCRLFGALGFFLDSGFPRARTLPCRLPGGPTSVPRPRFA